MSEEQRAVVVDRLNAGVSIAALQGFVERFLLGIQPPQDQPIVDQVREVLRNLTRLGPVDLSDVSQVLELHPRTLQRRLRAEGFAFEDLRDVARKSLAVQLRGRKLKGSGRPTVRLTPRANDAIWLRSLPTAQRPSHRWL